MKYSLDTIKKSWSEIFNSCELPNGQMAGRLPKMQMIENILLKNRLDKFEEKHESIKQEPVPGGLIMKLWDWGIEYHEGKITKDELEKKIEDNL